MEKEDCSLETKLLHTEFGKPDVYGSLSMPVYHTAAYEFNTAEEMEDAFVGRTSDFAYSRITNPTVQYFEDKVKNITDAFGVTALSSGMAAITNAIIALSYAGCNIVTSRHLFGNTYSFFVNTLAAFGVETRFCDMTDAKDVDKAIDENTSCVFLEIITNPQLEVADLQAVANVAHAKNTPLLADTTIIPFHVFKAKNVGVDIEIVSSTKYISGGATSLGGLIIDYGTFDWSNSKKLAAMSKDFGNATFTAKMRKEIHRNLGAYMTPHVAYMQTIGMETLAVRYDKVSSNCLELSKKLSTLAQIKFVHYPGLESSPYYEVSKKQYGEKPGAVLTFDLAYREDCFAFMNKLQLIKRATNLFDNKSLAIHPASTIFGTFSAEVRKEMNVSENTIRLSVGLENVTDLFEDIKQACTF